MSNFRKMAQTELFYFVLYSYLPEQQFSLHIIRKKRMTYLEVTCIPLNMFGMLYSNVGAGAVSESKFSPGAA
jgi:hypothetical protein